MKYKQVPKKIYDYQNSYIQRKHCQTSSLIFCYPCITGIFCQNPYCSSFCVAVMVNAMFRCFVCMTQRDNGEELKNYPSILIESKTGLVQAVAVLLLCQSLIRCTDIGTSTTCIFKILIPLSKYKAQRDVDCFYVLYSRGVCD